MALQYTDYNGHAVPDASGAALTIGALGTSAVGTIAPNANAGSSAVAALVSGVTPNDRRGAFTVASAGTGQAAGIIASVRFAQPYSAVPACVNLDAYNVTDSTATLTVGPANVTVAGFDIIGTILTTAKTYNIQYSVTV